MFIYSVPTILIWSCLEKHTTVASLNRWFEMRYYNLCEGGRALSIAILLVFLVFMGGAGALSDAAASDNVWENYPDILNSNGNLSAHSPGTPTLHPQRTAKAEFTTATRAPTTPPSRQPSMTPIQAMRYKWTPAHIKKM